MDPAARDPNVIASALFVDVGTTYHAYVYLEATRRGEVRVVRTWYVRHQRGWLADKLLMLDKYGGTFYVEAITGAEFRAEIFRGRDPAQLFETTKMEGRIQEAAEGFGKVPVEVQARAWRTVFLGPTIMAVRAPLDPVIRYAIRELYRDGGLPAPSEAHGREPEVHILDAVAGGMVCLAKQLGWRFTLPRHIAEGALRVALEEKSKRAARRAAKAAGIKLPGMRRRLSASQQAQANAKRRSTIAKKKLALR